MKITKHINELEERIEQLEKALREATGWNWLDADMPDEVVIATEAVLGGKVYHDPFYKW